MLAVGRMQVAKFMEPNWLIELQDFEMNSSHVVKEANCKLKALPIKYKDYPMMNFYFNEGYLIQVEVKNGKSLHY